MKKIKNYENYMATEDGRIYSIKRKCYLKLQTVTNGYLMVGLFKNGVSKYLLVHRLIAETFIEKPEKCDIVNHLDGNKKNNNVNNLEWTTQSENVRAYKAKYRKYNKPLYEYNENNTMTYSYKSYYEAALQNKTSVITLLKHIDNSIPLRKKYFSTHKDFVIEKKYKKPSIFSKPVIQYDLKMNKINEFNSTLEASKETGLYQPNICSCCNGRYKTAGGFIFRYKN